MESKLAMNDSKRGPQEQTGKRWGVILLLTAVGLISLTSRAASNETLYVQTGSDPAFAEVMAGGRLAKGRIVKPQKKIAEKMIGKPFHIRVRDNGHDFEVYLDGRQIGAGSWPRPEGETGFRWGMYLGEHPVRHEAMLFVTGVAIQ